MGNVQDMQAYEASCRKGQMTTFTPPRVSQRRSGVERRVVDVVPRAMGKRDRRSGEERRSGTERRSGDDRQVEVDGAGGSWPEMT